MEIYRTTIIMKWLNKYIVNISFICYYFSVSISLIIISFLLLVKNRKVVLGLSILLLLYSLYAMGLMGLVFIWWGLSNLLFSIIFCLTIPIMNLFFSIKLIINIRKRHMNT